MTSGKAVPGEEYLLNCTVEVIDRLIVTPTIVWIKDSVNTSLVSDDLNTISVPSVLTNISDTLYSLSLFFSSLNTSDAGQYTCQATITVNEINIILTNKSVQDLMLQSKHNYNVQCRHSYYCFLKFLKNISTFTSTRSFIIILLVPLILTMNVSRQSDYLAGSKLTITCYVTINPHINTPFIVKTMWTKDEILIVSSGNGRILLYNTSLTDYNKYDTQIYFSTLSSSVDSGIYTCIVDVLPVSGYIYITASNTTNVTTNITIIGKDFFFECISIISLFYLIVIVLLLCYFVIIIVDPIINELTISPDSYLGLETSCPASDPYDNFTLVCTASKPALVISALEVIWLHNGTERQGVVTNNSDGTYVINTLRFPISFANDSGTYSCHAKLSIPNSSVISVLKSITIILKSELEKNIQIHYNNVSFIQPKEIHLQP